MHRFNRPAMRRWGLAYFLLFALIAPGGAAQAPRQGASDSKAALETLQSRLDAAHVRAHAACLRDFLVNDCLDKEDRAYRAASADVRARLAVVERAERSRRAEALRASIASAAAAAEARPPAASQDAQARRAQRKRQLDEKQRDHREADAAAPARREAFEARQRGIAQTAPRDASSAARAAYLAKQADYVRRRAQARARASQQPDAAPLPLPGASR